MLCIVLLQELQIEMKLKITLLFLFIVLYTNAQSKDLKFGKISEQEINLTQVPFEKNAD